MSELRRLKKIYDWLKNDSVRSKVLSSAELLGIRKDVLRMDTNNFCNIQCIMCDRLSTSGEKHYMSLDAFTVLIDRLAPGLRRLYLSCACEPLATPHFPEYLKYAKSRGIPFVSFCTNALSLNQETMEKIVDCGTDEVIVSFNGFTKEAYQRIMYGSDYEKVCKNLKALTEYKEKCRTAKPEIRLNTMLLKTNLYHLEELKDFVLAYQIKTVQLRELQYYVNQNNPDEVEKELLTGLSREEYIELMEKMKKMAALLRSYGKEVLLPLSAENFRSGNYQAENPRSGNYQAENPRSGNYQAENHQAVNKISWLQKHQPPGKIPGSPKHPPTTKASCPVPYFSYWIDWEGNMRVCGYDEKAIIGNVLQDDFHLLKERRKQFQKLALRGECSRELCSINIETATFR